MGFHLKAKFMALNMCLQITKLQSKLFLGVLGKGIYLLLEEVPEINASSSGTQNKVS